MPKTALTEKLSASGATITEYCGADTARHFGNPRAEFEALRSAAAVYDLGWRSKIIVSGKDRVRWLNGMVTNNIRDLQPGRGNYNFLLTPQGRIQADLYAYNRGDYLVLATDRWQTPTILALLQKYIIMDKVELDDVSDRLTAIAIQGPKSREILAASGLNIPYVQPMEITDFVWNNAGLTATRMGDDNFVTCEIWGTVEDVGFVWKALCSAGASPAGTDALEMFRVAAGIPRYGLDISDRDLPHETSQDQALSFSKGCYIGQEIVERIRARGNVRRTLAGFVLENASSDISGTKIDFEGQEVGTVTSLRLVPSGGNDRTLGMGIIRREASKPGTVVTMGGARAIVYTHPFPEALSNT